MPGPYKISELLGSAKELAKIRPPGPSFEDWERFLREAADVAYYDGNGRENGIFTLAIRRRVWWLKDARERGLTYDEAEDAWCAMIEREHESLVRTAEQSREIAVRAAKERETNHRNRYTRKRPVEPVDDSTADELFTYADERIQA